MVTSYRRSQNGRSQNIGNTFGSEHRYTMSIIGYTFSVSYPVFFVADRKSTRLNSSHLVISYAVFCLKKTNVRTHLHQGDRRDGEDEMAQPVADVEGRAGRLQTAQRRPPQLQLESDDEQRAGPAGRPA